MAGVLAQVGKGMGTAAGAVAGLAAITPASGYVQPWAAIIIGAAAGLLCYGAVHPKDVFHYDDSLDVVGVHMVGRAIGVLLTDVFASLAVNAAGEAEGWTQLGRQAVLAIVGIACPFVMTWIILWVTDRTGRVLRPIRSLCLDLYHVLHYVGGMAVKPITERAFLVLTALAGGPRHGYGLVGEVAKLSQGRVELKIGSLYRLLDRLAAEGLIEADREEARDGRLRRYYRLTRDGRRMQAGGRPPSPGCACTGPEEAEPACRHRCSSRAGETAGDRFEGSGMIGNLERRYRWVLRLLPRWYQQQWEADMVVAFLDSWPTGDLAADEYISKTAGPGWAEAASVAGLALRLWLGGFRVPPPRLAPGFSLPARRMRAAAGMAVAGMLLAAGGCSSPAGPASAAGPAGAAVADCLTQALCYAPRQFRVAYGIQPLLDDGIDGRGQTVVLLEFAAPAGSPPKVTDIRQDLARFDHLFGLPVARLQVINSLARSASPWLASGEEVEDTEIVHAAAPGAAIREVLISDQAEDSPAAASADVAAALRLGLTQGAAISFSRSWGEQCFTTAEVAQLNSALQAARNHHVTVINSSGDLGAAANPCPGAGAAFTAVKGVNLLDADPLVLAAGGTSLQANRSTGAYVGETVWNTPPGFSSLGFSASSGGGFSQLFPRPAYQDGVPGIGATRGVPDVAADADPDTGMAVAVSEGGQRYILAPADGTSAAAPLWAAVTALADQYAGRPLGFVNPAIYRIGRSPFYYEAFHDITAGTNTVQDPQRAITVTGYRAAPGWDPVTGWGSPNAQVLVPLLARYASP